MFLRSRVLAIICHVMLCPNVFFLTKSFQEVSLFPITVLLLVFNQNVSENNKKLEACPSLFSTFLQAKHHLKRFALLKNLIKATVNIKESNLK